MTRFVIGIDLGTTNSALTYADVERAKNDGRPTILALEVPQLVSPGDVKPRRLLSSSLYTPSKFELAAEQMTLPWEREPGKLVVGEAARRLGAKTPGRLTESAKSWLCHGGVNRTAAILPWHAPEEVPKLSPVEVSAKILAHLAAAWDHEIAKGDPELAFVKQDVVLTVPASFDEDARQLTLEAAKRAGYPTVTLLEEPLAAFYAFVARTGGTPAATGLKGGERILIADVGGGTTDFTLIEVRAGEDGGLGFERTAVGDHLLLGGDNMDLALAHAIEPSLGGGKKLDPEAFAHLKLECRLAKEALFTDLSRPGLPIVVVGRGSKLIGGTLRGELPRAVLEQVVTDGYFPALPPGEEALPAKAVRTGFAEYGLPYASEPRITRHLAAFLLRHRRAGEPAPVVDAVLFNGGALKPTAIRDRITETLGAWLRSFQGRAEAPDPRALVYDQHDEAFELAVAQGAAYYGLVRAGAGVRISGGSPREYFLRLDGGSPGEGELQVLCVAPKGMQDGQQLEVSSRDFQLVTNRPVQFPIYTSTGPETHEVGAVLTKRLDELHELPPLMTVVKFGKHQAGTTIPVRLQAKRTELGTLELSCFSRMSGARFRLEFDLRSTEQPRGSEPPPPRASRPPSVAEQPFGGAGTRPPPEAGDVPPERLEAAKRRLDETFKVEPPRLDPDQLMKGLEEDLGLKRDAFPLPALRGLSERLLELTDRRAISAELEARWLNAVGFCLRPGMGFPLDDWRVRQLWKIHAEGLRFPGRDPTELGWWILWRRVAPGLARGHQLELQAELWPMLVPSLAKRAKKKPPRSQTQEAVEMWRIAASLERVDAKQRAALGDALLDLVAERRAPKSALWCLGRLGARRLLYGPREATVRAQTVSGWVERLIGLDKPSKDEAPKDCLIAMARLVGDRQFDLEDDVRGKVRAYLEAQGVAAEALRPLVEVVELDRESEQAAFGEGLPTGLRL